MTQHSTQASDESFAFKLRQGQELVYDLRANIGGEARYFIIQVQPAKKEAFLRAVNQDSGYRLEDFGTILHRGWDEPDDELKQQLHARYGLYTSN